MRNLLFAVLRVKGMWFDMAPVGLEFGSKSYNRLNRLNDLVDAAIASANRMAQSVDEMVQAVEESNNRIRKMEKRKS